MDIILWFYALIAGISMILFPIPPIVFMLSLLWSLNLLKNESFETFKDFCIWWKGHIKLFLICCISLLMLSMNPVR